MALPAASYISQLDPARPDGATETKAEGDNWLRLLQYVLQTQFPSLGTTAVTATAAQLNTITDKASLSGQTYSGTHDFSSATLTAATGSPGANTTAAATTAFVTAAMAALSATEVDLTTTIVAGTSQQAEAGARYVLTNGAATAVATPTSPTIGMRFGVKVANGLATNTIAYASDKIEGLAETMTLNHPYAAVELVYVDATEGWVLI